MNIKIINHNQMKNKSIIEKNENMKKMKCYKYVIF